MSIRFLSDKVPQYLKTFDGIFFEGKAERPTYLFINGKSIQLLDASELWGKDGKETEKIIEKYVSR